MPPATIHLVALSPQKSIPAYLDAINASSSDLIVASKVVRWIIRPEVYNTELLNTKWDLLLVLLKSSPLDESLLSQEWVSNHFALTAGIPSGLLKNFKERNERLLHPPKGDVPALAGSKPLKTSSAQELGLDDELDRWAGSFSRSTGGAVSMLNLLAFKPGKEAHESYLAYGRGFAESAGAKRGGTAKLVGKVIDEESCWQEVALAHYPSAEHFAEMLASRDYQEINHRFRLPALRDTCILCTSELDPVFSRGKAKL